MVSTLAHWTTQRSITRMTIPVRLAYVREERGLRGGGLGILLISQLVDELVYNERHNEVQFVKYLSRIEGDQR